MAIKRYEAEERTVGEVGHLPKDVLLRELNEVVEDIYAKQPTAFDITVHASLDELPTINVRFEGNMFPDWETVRKWDAERKKNDAET